MRILLVQPPLVPSGPVEPPVGLAALAAWLIRAGHRVRILDLDLHQRLHGACGVDAGAGELARQLEEFVPDVAGFTSMYSNSLLAARLIAMTKSLQPGVTTVAGGSHFGALARQSLERHPALDFVIQGEGEAALETFLDQLHSGCDWSKVPSLVYRSAGGIVLNPPGPLIDLKRAPNAWASLGEALDISRYLDTLDSNAPHRVAYVEAGRGCPYECSFCATAPFWERAYRVKSIETIVEEIRFLRRFGYDRFVFVHDLLTVNRRFVSELCDRLIESRMPIEWMANSRTDIRLDGLLPKMKAAGCWKLFFGIESASPDVQRAIRKHLDINASTEMIQRLSSHGITSTCSFVFGFANETPRQVSESIELGARMKLLGSETVQFHRLRIWPPAELSTMDMVQEFDRESLEIEYPLLEIPPSDLDEIRSSPDFFGGYFVPLSAAGNRSELANLEMFTHHVLAIAPMTIYALQRFRPGDLVGAFYSVLRRLGPISRKMLDWDGGGLLANWRVIRPYLLGLVEALALDDPAELAVVHGLLAYEEKRVEFTVTPAPDAGEENLPTARIPCSVDIPAAISHPDRAKPRPDPAPDRRNPVSPRARRKVPLLPGSAAVR
jgi:radical SAM superfamily enzyme YgiQ (UPF0313 family)